MQIHIFCHNLSPTKPTPTQNPHGKIPSPGGASWLSSGASKIDRLRCTAHGAGRVLRHLSWQLGPRDFPEALGCHGGILGKLLRPSTYGLVVGKP